MFSIPASFYAGFEPFFFFFYILPQLFLSRLGHMGLSLLFSGKFLTLILFFSLCGLYQGQVLATCL